MKLSAFAFILFAAAIPTAAQHDEDQEKQAPPASYWQLNQGVSSAVYNYSISLESKEPEKLEERIAKLAEEAGLIYKPNQYQYQYQNSSSPAARNMYISGDAEKAEPFCQKVIAMPKLKQYSANASISDRNYVEIKKKAKLIEEELTKNAAAMEAMPIARSLLSDLAGRYKAFLTGYETALKKASVTITITLLK